MERADMVTYGISTEVSERISEADDLLQAFCVGSENHVERDTLTEPDQSNPLPAGQLALSPDKAYIVTGGATGLSIGVAKWLVDKGARKLVLLSRTGPKTQHDINRIQELISGGINVDYEYLDMTFSQAVVNCIGRIRLNAPIGGVIHSAAVLRDITVPYMSEKVFYAVFVPKVVGAWNLHLALGDEPVDFFVNISTASAIVGLNGQSVCSASNKLLDELATCRKLKGLKVQSVNLGVLGHKIRESGNMLHVLEAHGWTPLSFSKVTAEIERAITEACPIQIAMNAV